MASTAVASYMGATWLPQSWTGQVGPTGRLAGPTGRLPGGTNQSKHVLPGWAREPMSLFAAAGMGYRSIWPMQAVGYHSIWHTWGTVLFGPCIRRAWGTILCGTHSRKLGKYRFIWAHALRWQASASLAGQNFAKGKMTFERSKPERSYIRATLLACVALQLLAQLLTLAAPSGSAGWLAWPGHWLAGLAWPGKA